MISSDLIFLLCLFVKKKYYIYMLQKINTFIVKCQYALTH